MVPLPWPRSSEGSAALTEVSIPTLFPTPALATVEKDEEELHQGVPTRHADLRKSFQPRLDCAPWGEGLCHFPGRVLERLSGDSLPRPRGGSLPWVWAGPSGTKVVQEMESRNGEPLPLNSNPHRCSPGAEKPKELLPFGHTDMLTQFFLLA